MNTCWLPGCPVTASCSIMGTSTCVNHIDVTISLTHALIHHDGVDTVLGYAHPAKR